MGSDLNSSSINETVGCFNPHSHMGSDANHHHKRIQEQVSIHTPTWGVTVSAVESGQISTSYIQRNYEVGFNRAGRIMTQLERAGIVGPQTGAKQREIKFYDMQSLEAKLQDLGVF